ncbi:MAG: alpha/beta fold hydrolase [Myxococcota bacterium]
MPTARANGIEIAYECAGEGEPVVLIMGIGAQLVHWPDGFLSLLHERGYRTIRFDNRDVGCSTRFTHARVPNVRKLVARWALGLPVPAPYTLSDMAGDVAGLMDHLGLEDAHVLGVSMGGMIAQTFAIEHPSRVRTLTSIMSTTGERLHAVPKPHALRALLLSAPRSREESIDRAVAFFRTVGSPDFPFDEADLRERAGRAYDRGIDPRGFLRHMAAILASGSRKRRLRSVRAPTLVLHGAEDPLVRPPGGRSTARAIPGAKLQLIPGMGHDLPHGVWPILVAAFDDHARRRG